MNNTSKWLKTMVTSLLVTMALVLPISTVGDDSSLPILGFEGVEMIVHSDGSVQMLFDVYVSNNTNGDGAFFTLEYNENYLVPSNILDNAEINPNGYEETDAFFRVKEGLYGGGNPFAEKPASSGIQGAPNNYASVNGTDKTVSLFLVVNHGALLEESDVKTTIQGGKLQYVIDELYEDDLLTPIPYGFSGQEWAFIYDAGGDKRVVLGQVSFRVTDPAKLPEIIAYFEQVDEWEDPVVDGNKLIDLMDGTKPETGTRTDWGVAYYGAAMDDGTTQNLGQIFAGSDEKTKSVTSLFTFNFPPTVIDVRAAERELTINAYQAYTYGDMRDLAIALGKYSPMVTVTYADGTKENHVFQWNKEAKDEYKASYYDESATDKVGSAVTDGDDGNYTATGGDYIITQKYVYTDYLGVEQVFPVPVKVHMTVTPIKLVEVTASDLTRTYTLNGVDRVSGVVSKVNTGADLDLPEYARLVTDVVPGGVSMVMEISGWMPEYGRWPVAAGSDAADDTLMNSVWGNEGGTVYWPDDHDRASGDLVPAKHVGDYTFVMATDYTTSAKKDEYFTKGEITAKYPWLTVPEEKYKMPEALRRIVSDTDTFTPAEYYEVTYVKTVTHVSEEEGDPSNGNPTLTLNVKKTSGGMLETSQFRVWLPNGQELGTGLSSTDAGDIDPSTGAASSVNVDNWFDSNGTPAVDEAPSGDDVNGFYNREMYNEQGTGNHTFNLHTNPGDTYKNPTADNAAQREVLRRYINLGGWFYVSVNEYPTTNLWSDPIPVYVPPRVNFYTENKFYDFSGNDNGLFHWIFGDGLGTTVTMPQGTYTGLIRNANGDPVTDDSGDTVTGEIEYGYTTTYDGNTGAEPGMNYTFAIEPDASTGGWKQDSSTPGTYGANDFKNEATYTAYGTVNQPWDANGSGAYDDGDTLAMDRTVTILTDRMAQAAPTEGLELKCVTPNANVLYDTVTGNVALATYDTQTEGYTVRQDYVFTLTNTGTTDIYGIGIDTITDGYYNPDNKENDKGGGHFELLLPPATFLRAGETTTFVLTYVYDLRADGENPLTYRDTLHVTTAANPEGVIDFDAQFQVAGTKIHKVTVVTVPPDGSLGTAGVIVGEVTEKVKKEDGTETETKTMNYTPASTAYVAGEKVYVVVRPVDEYTETVKIVDASGNTVPDLNTDPDSINYTYPDPDDPNPATLADGTRVYYFKMPASDVTVTVTFQEDLRSKLRLEDLVDFSGNMTDENNNLIGFRAQPGSTDGDLSVAVDPSYVHKVWQKAFTTDELNYAAGLRGSTGTTPGGGTGGSTSGVSNDEDKLYLMLMEQGEAGVYAFDSSVDIYMVVIPYEAEWSQIQATIRELADHDLNNDGTPDNNDIAVTVQMDWFSDWSEVTGPPTGEPVDLDVVENVGYTGNMGTIHTEDDSTTHVSDVFKSPEPGDSDYVRITLSASDGGDTQYRHYYLEIHRTDRDMDRVLGYGNSPFGMIMNASKMFHEDDPAQTAAHRADAMQAFIDAGYTFQGVSSEFVPGVVENNMMHVSGDDDPAGRAAVYWREAWSANDSLYEPESGTGVGDDSVYYDDRVEAGLDDDPYGYFLDDPYRLYNLDLYEYSLFAILGQPLTDPGLISAVDSSGREVKVEEVRVECEVTLLDTTGDTQIERFSGTGTPVTLSMGMSGFKNTDYEDWAAQTTGTDADGKPIKVQVDNIRPGRYVMEYVYADYDGTEVRVTRPFVILAPLGDVNADLTVDNRATTDTTKDKTNDEYLVENRVNDPLGWYAGSGKRFADGIGKYSFANIFKYRVCDVNNDRNVNNIDANELEAYAETAVTRENYPLFYLPTGYAG